MESTGVVDANLIAVTSTLITGTLVNVDALVALPPESHLAADLLLVRMRCQRVPEQRLFELCLVHAFVMSGII